jgi:hypothetical protein
METREQTQRASTYNAHTTLPRDFLVDSTPAIIHLAPIKLWRAQEGRLCHVGHKRFECVAQCERCVVHALGHEVCGWAHVAKPLRSLSWERGAVRSVLSFGIITSDDKTRPNCWKTFMHMKTTLAALKWRNTCLLPNLSIKRNYIRISWHGIQQTQPQLQL